MGWLKNLWYKISYKKLCEDCDYFMSLIGDKIDPVTETICHRKGLSNVEGWVKCNGEDRVCLRFCGEIT